MSASKPDEWKRDLVLQIQPSLERIERILQGKYRLTLVARYIRDDLDDADIVLTIDELPRAIAALERLSTREPAVAPGTADARSGHDSHQTSEPNKQTPVGEEITDAERDKIIEACAKVAENFRDNNPYPTVYAAIAESIRKLKQT